ncbi:MAG: hypothetical protein QM674_09135 [Burkholderiaceae bacterium]
MSTTLSEDRIPVIVGVADLADRPARPQDGREPIALMEDALRAAAADAGGGLLADLDALYLVCEVSWLYDQPERLLAQRLGVAPRTLVYGPVGGETPIRFLHESALAIARGECRVAAVTGAEAQYSVNKARAAGVALPWTPQGTAAAPARSRDKQHPLSAALGIAQPITVYPLYENAAPRAWGQTPAQARAESARIWSTFSQVAADTPSAWGRQAFAPDEVGEPSADNRLIAWPYTKRMVANPAVNQGAAVILTSLARARRMGVDPSRCIRVLGGAAANEADDFLQRDDFLGTASQQVVLETAAALANRSGTVDAIELYSCFPIVPKMAMRVLGLGPRTPLTTIGGLSFFGAPLNNYMTHATCGMVRRLRAHPQQQALLYGQGGLATKHHALVLAGGLNPRAADATDLRADYSVQAIADARRGPVPALNAGYEGPAGIETFTILYDRSGQPASAAVIGRNPAGERVLARIEGSDADALARLVDDEAWPTGAAGIVSRTADGVPAWRFATTP